MKFQGANNVILSYDSHILIETNCGNITESIPLSFQLDGNNNNQRKIIANFTQLTTNTFGISVRNYDKTKTLIIDPVPWATYYGGNGTDEGAGIVTDVIGNVFIVGATSSTSAIATSGSYQTTISGSDNAFIAKFNSSGIRQWATYFGGNGSDGGSSIAIDSIGNITITGTTTSTSGIATSGTHQTSYSGGGDIFIAKFNSSGTRLWATYYGGTGYDIARGVVTDGNANIVIVGITISTSGIATSGAYQTSYTSGSGSPSDAFIAKFNSSGTRLWATYFGGPGTDEGNGIATDTSGNIVFTGLTGSTSGIATSGAYQTTIGGAGGDAFIAKFNSSGAIQWCTYYGGSGSDAGNGIDTEKNGDILVAGQTNSTSAISSSGSYQVSFGGSYDAFIVKLNSSGSRVWATYYGGSGVDIGKRITKDPNENILLTGQTVSTSAISSSGAYQSAFGGGSNDAFVVKFDSTGSRLWATYLGGTGADYGGGIAADLNGNIFIVGNTLSSSGISTTGAFQTTIGDTINGDAFIAAFTNMGNLPVQLIYFDINLIEEKETLKVRCNWTTASEINNSHFSMERSKNGENFQEIGQVNGVGNSINNTNYYFVDEFPLGGISYYRLKQTDFDGASSLSETKVINLDSRLPLSVSLVYVDDIPTLIFASIANQKFNIELFSLSGTAFYASDYMTKEGRNVFPIKSSVSGGLYILRTVFADKERYFKVWLK